MRSTVLPLRRKYERNRTCPKLSASPDCPFTLWNLPIRRRVSNRLDRSPSACYNVRNSCEKSRWRPSGPCRERPAGGRTRGTARDFPGGVCGVCGAFGAYSAALKLPLGAVGRNRASAFSKPHRVRPLQRRASVGPAGPQTERPALRECR